MPDSEDRTPASDAAVRWNEIDAVLLDMDGTILDLGFDIHFWKEVVPARYAEQQGIELSAAQRWLAPHFSSLEGTLPWYCLDHWSALTAIDMAALKREVRHRIRPLPGSVEFLHAVRASGRPLWLVTNAHRDSWQLKLEHTGLVELFDQVICSHDFGAPKEDARFWSAFAASHAFDPARALFADDNLAVLAAARAFGIGHPIAIGKPVIGGDRRPTANFIAVDALVDLLPIKASR